MINLTKNKVTINNPTFIIFKRLAKYVLYKIASYLTVERFFQAIAKDDIKESKKKDDKVRIFYFSFSVNCAAKKIMDSKTYFLQKHIIVN